MKEVFFNSLTQNAFMNNDEVKAVVDNYIAVVKHAASLGYKKVCYDTPIDYISLTKTESLKSYCSKHSREPGCMLLLTMQSYPYIKDDDKDKIEKYIDGKFYLQINGKEYDDICFAAAYLSNSFLVGFSLSDEAIKFKYTLKGKVCGEEFEEILYCIVYEQQYGENDFCKWFKENDCVEESSISKSAKQPEEKKIVLRNDHGYDVLYEHAKKLRMSPYVESIINSMPFNPNARHYIYRVKANGIIELVLTNTDCGYGMVVQTTGRNRKETLWIAKKLKDEYAD